MAARTLYPTQDAGPTNWSAAAWSEADDNAKDQTKPVAGDTVIFTSNSGSIQMDEDSEVLLAFTQSGGTLDGNDGTQWVLKVGGNSSHTGGTATNVSLLQTGTSDLRWSSGTSNALLEYNTDATSDITLTGAVYFKKATVHASATLGGTNQPFYCYLPTAANYLSMAGTISPAPDVTIQAGAAYSNNGVIVADDFALTTTDDNMTFSAAITANMTNIRGGTNQYGSLTLAGSTSGCSFGVITLGASGTNRSGKLDLGGNHVDATSIADGSSAAASANALTFNGGTLDIDGGACNLTDIDVTDVADIECAGDFTIDATSALPDGSSVTLNGTGNLSANVSGNRADLEINTAGTHTSATDQYWDSFTLTAGTYADGGLDHTIAGSIVRNAGTLTSTGTWTMTAVGNLKQSTTTQSFAELVIGDGSTFTATLTGSVCYKKLSIHSAATVTGNQVLYCYLPSGNDYIDMSGTIGSTVDVTIQAGNSYSNQYPITADALVITCTNDIQTYTGVITAASTNIRGGTNQYGHVIVGVANCDFGAVTLGAAGTNRSGKLDLGDSGYAVTMASLADASAGNGSVNAMDFGTAIVTLSGTIDGSDITATAGATPRANGGTISNVNLGSSNYLDARGVDGDSVTDGGGNTNVRFARGLVGGGVF